MGDGLFHFGLQCGQIIGRIDPARRLHRQFAHPLQRVLHLVHHAIGGLEQGYAVGGIALAHFQPPDLRR